MLVRKYKPLKRRMEPIIEGVTTWADLYPPLEYDLVEVCDECKKQECECNK